MRGIPGFTVTLVTLGISSGRGGRAVRGTVAGMGARIVAAAASFVTVPLLLGYLGVERYGLWVTAATLTAWVGLGHLGLPPSLLTKLAATRRDDRSSRAALVTTAWWLSIGLGLALLVPLFLLDAVGAWPSLFNVENTGLVQDARVFAIAMWLGVAIAMPLAIPVTVLRADQDVHKASVIEATATIARLVAIVLAVGLGMTLTWLAAAAVVAPLLVLVIAAMRVFGARVGVPRIRSISSLTGRALLATGVGFLGIATAALLITSTDVLIIAQLLGPSVVPTYSVPFALLLLFMGLGMAVLDALWPAYAEAAAVGDRRWVESANRAAIVGLVTAATVFAVGLAVFGVWFIERWAGPEAVPPRSLLLVLGAIAIVQGVLLPHGRLLTALGRVRRNTGLSLAGAAVNVPVSIALAPILGVTGVALGTLAAYLATGSFLVRNARTAMRAIPVDSAGGPASDEH